MTCIETENRNTLSEISNDFSRYFSVSKSKEILKLKVKGIYFIVDVFGALPLYSLLSNLMEEENARIRPLFLLNYLIGMIIVSNLRNKSKK